MKPIRTLVLLANDERARMFENAGVGKGVTEIEDMAAQNLMGEEVDYADRPGRNSAAPGVAQHAFAEPQAVHDQERERFARQVLSELEAQFSEGRYDRLVLVAAPAMLGTLRGGMSKPLKQALAVDLDKDFLKLKPDELVDRLASHIVL